jgi:WD40 repeat protein
VQLIDLPSGKIRDTLPGNRIYHLAWQRDGKTLAVGQGRLLTLCDAATGKKLAQLEGHKSDGVNMTFNQTGDLVASIAWEGMLHVWDPRSGQHLLKVPDSWDRHLAFVAGNRLPVLAGTKVQLWEVVPTAICPTLTRDLASGQRQFNGLAVSPKDNLLAVATNGGVGFWATDSGSFGGLRRFGDVRAVVFAPSGDLLTNGPGGLYRHELEAVAAPERWRAAKSSKLPLPGGKYQIAASADGQVLARAEGGAARVWRAATPSSAKLLRHAACAYVSVSPDGRWVATGSHGQSAEVRIWDAKSGEPARSLTTDRFSRVGFSADGNWLTAERGGLRLWEVPSWREGPVIGGGTFAFSPPDNRLLAVETGKGVVRLVAPASGLEYCRLEDPDLGRATAMAFTRDGNKLAVITESETLRLWDLRLIRAELAARGLDWDLPVCAPDPAAALGIGPPAMFGD